MKTYSAVLLFCVLFLYGQKPISKFSANASSLGSSSAVNFFNESTNGPTSYSWEFVGGSPAVSTIQNPIINYSSPGTYIVKLTVSNANGSSVSTRTLKITSGASSKIFLNTGYNDASNTLMGDVGFSDSDWTYTDPNNNTSTPVTRFMASGWSFAQITTGLLESRWITGNNTITGNHYYVSKNFEIPSNVTNAVLNLRCLSFIRSWTYLVKVNPDNTTTETQITNTLGTTNGWMNSQNPLVSNYPLEAGAKYYIKVKAYTNTAGQRQAVDVNAQIDLGNTFVISPRADFSASSLIASNGNPVQFTNLSAGTPISYSWNFQDGANVIASNLASPSVVFNNTGFHNSELIADYGNGMQSSLKINDYIETTAEPDYTLAPNSYIFDINKANDENYDGISIPVKKAYEMWSRNQFFKNQDNIYSPIPEGSKSADVFWEDVPGLIKNIQITGNGAEAKLNVKIDRAKGKGNAVVAFKVDSKIYWSWHIWITDDPTNGVSYAQGFETDINNNSFTPQYMDRNIGAVNESFLGNDWHKSGGLMYQWGRKDPIPALEYKDGSVYEVVGSAGVLRHPSAINTLNSSKIKMTTRGIGTTNYTGSNFINDNIKYSISHPIDFIVHTENTATWFSSQQYKVPNNDITKIETWDLWSDNRKGKFSSQRASDPIISEDSRSYEIKSSFDPCPNGWRVPSNYMSAGVNNNQNPFGRKDSGANDDDTPNSIFYPNSVNENLNGIKVYPGLGIDFTGSTANRNMGIMPLPGNYEYYSASGQAIYQDPGADGLLMTSTYGTVENGGAAGIRGFLITSDPGQPDTTTGRNEIKINEIFSTSGSGAVRCMRDPNYVIANYDFVTEYFSSPQSFDVKTYKTWSQDPNSFIRMTNTSNPDDRIVDINLRKAYAMQRLYLNENNEMPSGAVKSASIQWTSNTNLINKYEIIEGGESSSILRVTLNPDVQGNAVIAFHLGNNGVWGTANPDKILWSWHIWAPATNPTAEENQITYHTESVANGGIVSTSNPNFINPTKSGTPPLSTTFMDRNLGAVTSFPNADGMGGTAIANDTNIRNSGGLHYQWGRKDPIPTFFTPGGVATTTVFRQVGYTGNAISYGVAINDATFTSGSTVEYNNYSSMSGVITNDSKSERNRKIIKYSVENPFTFMYHNRSASEIYFLGPGTYQSKSLQIKDWISPAGEIGNAPDRWGHATEKSPYDPCPSGWRIPDTFRVSMVNGADKGTSPWFYNNYKKTGTFAGYGFSQAFPFNLKGSKTNNNSETERLYPGKMVKKFTAPATVVGWEFKFDGSFFNIGNFPNTGIRGILGGNDWVDRYDLTTQNYKKITGVWTASLGDKYTGYAIAMQIDEYSANGELLTGVGHYPQAGMGVRCAKDLPRYIINDFTPKQGQQVKVPVNSKNINNLKLEILLFPNPTSGEIFVNTKVKSFRLYDLSGKLLIHNELKQVIDLSPFPNGEYIIVLTTDQGEIVSKKIIKK